MLGKCSGGGGFFSKIHDFLVSGSLLFLSDISRPIFLWKTKFFPCLSPLFYMQLLLFLPNPTIYLLKISVLNFSLITRHWDAAKPIIDAPQR